MSTHYSPPNKNQRFPPSGLLGGEVGAPTCTRTIRTRRYTYLLSPPPQFLTKGLTLWWPIGTQGPWAGTVGESAREGEPVGSLGSKDPTSVHSPFTPLRSSPLASLDHSRAPPPPRVPTIGTGTFPAMRPNGGYRRGGGVGARSGGSLKRPRGPGMRFQE